MAGPKINAGSAVVEILFDTKGVVVGARKASQASAGLAGKVEKDTKRISRAFKSAFKVGLGAAVAGAGVAVAKSIKSFTDYQAALTEVSTLVDTNVVSMAKYQDALLSLPSSLGGVAENTRALYQAISAGLQGTEQELVDFVGQAAKLAKAGGADSAQAVDILTTALNAYGLEASEATKISDALFQTVKLGKTTIPELANNMGKLIPIAASAGVGFDQISAALATLTKGGLGTDIAITSLRAALVGMTGNASKFRKEGIDVAEVLRGPNGLQNAIMALSDVTGNSTEAIKELGVDTFGLISVQALAGKQADDFSDSLDAMGDKAGSTEEATVKMAGSISEKFKTLGVVIEKIQIRIVDKFAPAIVRSLEWLADTFDNVLAEVEGLDAQATKNFENFATKSGKKIVKLNDQIAALSEQIVWAESVSKNLAEVMGKESKAFQDQAKQLFRLKQRLVNATTEKKRFTEATRQSRIQSQAASTAEGIALAKELETEEALRVKASRERAAREDAERKKKEDKVKASADRKAKSESDAVIRGAEREKTERQRTEDRILEIQGKGHEVRVQRINRERDELIAALGDMGLSAQEFADQRVAIESGASSQISELVKTNMEATKSEWAKGLDSMAQNFKTNLTDKIVEFMKTGKLKLGDIFKQIRDDFFKIVASQISSGLTGSLTGALGGLTGGGGGGGKSGGLGGLLGGITGGKGGLGGITSGLKKITGLFGGGGGGGGVLPAGIQGPPLLGAGAASGGGGLGGLFGGGGGAGGLGGIAKLAGPLAIGAGALFLGKKLFGKKKAPRPMTVGDILNMLADHDPKVGWPAFFNEQIPNVLDGNTAEFVAKFLPGGGEMLNAIVSGQLTGPQKREAFGIGLQRWQQAGGALQRDNTEAFAMQKFRMGGLVSSMAPTMGQANNAMMRGLTPNAPVPVIAHPGEGFLSRQGVQAAGGPGGVARLNNGGGGGGGAGMPGAAPIIVNLVMDGQVLARQLLRLSEQGTKIVDEKGVRRGR